jgi:hypothetical protein
VDHDNTLSIIHVRVHTGSKLSFIIHEPTQGILANKDFTLQWMVPLKITTMDDGLPGLL